MDPLTRLAVAASAGDRVALYSFVRASQADVWRLCARLAGSASADDLTQEVYVRALAALPRFRAESSARTWLLAIARYTVADEIRSRQMRRRHEKPSAPAAPVSGPEDHVALVVAVDELDSDRRLAFVLTQILGLSYAEAAEVCDCPVGTIRSRVARARDDLVRIIDGDADAANSQ